MYNKVLGGSGNTLYRYVPSLVKGMIEWYVDREVTDDIDGVRTEQVASGTDAALPGAEANAKREVDKLMQLEKWRLKVGRHLEAVEVHGGSYEVTLSLKCLGKQFGRPVPCSRDHVTLLRLSVKDIDRWANGALVQRVWPNMSSDDREALKTGMCPSCWEAHV